MRKLSTVFVDPLIAGLWGVLLAVASFAFGSVSLLRAWQSGSWERYAGFGIGGVVFVFSIYAIGRRATRTFSRSLNFQLVTLHSSSNAPRAAHIKRRCILNSTPGRTAEAHRARNSSCPEGSR